MSHGAFNGLTATVQLQPKEIERAKRAHHRSAVCCNRLLDTTLFVGGTSVAHGANLHDADGIVDAIDDPIVADAQAPEIDGTSQLLAPYGARLGDEGLDASKHPLYHSPVEPLQLLSSGAGEPDLELTHCV